MDLSHLGSTPRRQRIEIDKLVAVLFEGPPRSDPRGARDALIDIGKPAFTRLLAGMAKACEQIEESCDARELLLRLQFADAALRQMDGWLDSKSRPLIGPESEKQYVRYIISVHFKRWERTLVHLDPLPGPFTPDHGPLGRHTVVLVEEWLDHCEVRERVGWDAWLTNTRSLVGLMFKWEDLHALPSKRALQLLSRLPEALKARHAVGDPEGNETRPRTALYLVRQLAENEYVHLRETADQCLRALYDRSVSYDAEAPPTERKEKAGLWLNVIDWLEQR